MSLHERLAEFPNENLVMRGENCSVIHKVRVSPLKKSVLKSHFTSKKQSAGKEKLLKSKHKESMIIEAFKAAENKQMLDSTLPMNERAFRMVDGYFYQI